MRYSRFLLLAAVLLAACSPLRDDRDAIASEDAMTVEPQFALPAKPIRVAFDVIRHDVRFEGRAVLDDAAAAALSRTLSGYHLEGSDTIRLVAFGDQPRALADRRLAGVAGAVAALGHRAAIGGSLDEAGGGTPREGAGVAVLIGRWNALVPGCPDWSQPAGSTFDNVNTSNFGCADAVNLAGMLEEPRDLLRGRPFTGAAAGLPASAAGLYGGAESATANETKPIEGRFTVITSGGEDTQ